MANSQSSAFSRIYPVRDHVRGRSLHVAIWNLLDGLLLLTSLVLACFIVDILATRGHLAIDKPGDALELDRICGGMFMISADSMKEENYRFNLQKLREQDYGLVSAVWWSRHTIWGRPLAALYRSCSMLQNLTEALTLLMGLLVAVLIVRKGAKSKARGNALNAALDVTDRLRKSLHRQSLRLGPSDLDGHHNDLALDLFTVQMERIRNGLFAYILGCTRNGIAIVLLLILALTVDWHLTLLCLIPLAASWYFQERRQAHADGTDRLTADRLNTELKLLSESLNKSRLVRGYNMENFEHDRFQLYLERYRKNEYAFLYNQSRMGALATLLIFLCLGVVALILVFKVIELTNPVPISIVVLLLMIFTRSAFAVQGLWWDYRTRRDVSLAADRILRYINQIPEVGQPVGARFLQPLGKFLQFEAVTYAMPSTQKKLLDAFDLRIHAGSTTAIVAVEPLSARALANLLPRFIEAQSGRVLFDGEDIAWGTLDSLRAEVIYVNDRDPFFTGTVLENITCGSSDYALQDATEAAKVAHAHHFILKLPQGYETVLGEHGEQLDPGQSFRLGLARAIMRNPALLIIEEPVEALDEDTKSLLDDAYTRVSKDRTVLFLPTRLSTIRRAAQIVFIHEGKVQAVGTHAELLKSSAHYRHWEYLQFNQFRHAVEAGE
ncbi:MAG: ABC transporter transmembrane domain-containing protein [Planctomycetaceae bacterium]